MKLSHSTYIQANGVNKDNHYDGAVMVSKWYERNLKIFSNIQNLVRDKQCQRLFILYGAGHLQILRDLIKADDNLKLVEPCAYLPIK
jgi:hypothetical protein